MFKMLYSSEKLISRKYPVLPIEKFPFLVQPRNVIMVEHHIQKKSNFHSVTEVVSFKWWLMGGISNF